MDRRVAASPRHRAPTVEEADESAVWINAITVPQGQGPELEKRFAARQHSVDREPEFEGFQLPRPTAGEDRHLVVTPWTSEEALIAWRDGLMQAGHAAERAGRGARWGAAATGQDAVTTTFSAFSSAARPKVP